MRIIAGTAKGLHLHVPRGEIRPTMDVVRGAIFSSLGEAVIGAQVLDLFAGCGAFGIEALSRGATSVTFVENNRSHATAITRNLASARLTGNIVQSDALYFLERKTQPFDLIFADPPYAKNASDRDYVNELCSHPRLLDLLAPCGTIIIECEPRQPHTPPQGLVLLSEKRYGKTAIRFYIHGN